MVSGLGLNRSDAACADDGATVVVAVAASRDVAHWKRMRLLSTFNGDESCSRSSCEFLLSLRYVVLFDSCTDVTDVGMGWVNATAADNW